MHPRNTYGFALGMLALLVGVMPSTARTAPAGETPGHAEEAAPAAVAVGAKAPDFTLTDTDGKSHKLSDYTAQGKVVVLEWFNPECPFVKKHHQLTHSMNDTFAFAKKAGVVWLAVNSGAEGKQGAGLERNAAARKEYGMEYPVLLDESGAVGKLYGAKTTPHMFVIDEKGVLIYRGGIDDDASPKTLGKTNFVRTCLEAHAAAKPVTANDTKPYGCSVKYAS
jgi:peroxiredoxin